MDENVDLTIEALFARDSNPRLMLDVHFREHQKRTSADSGLEAIDPSYVGRKIATMIAGMVLPSLPQGLDADFEWLERHSRVFGPSEANRIHRTIDPYAFMYDGSECDCCGIGLNALTNVRNFGVCVECNRRLEQSYGESSSAWDAAIIGGAA